MNDPPEQPLLVAHIIYRLGIGGLENGLVNLINGSSPQRYSHAIICLAGYDDFSLRIRRDNVEIINLGKREGKDLPAYFRLYRLLKKLRPGIVHTRNFAALDCQFVAAAAGVKVRIHGEHGWDAGDLHGTLGKKVLMRRMSRRLVKHYVAVSRHMATWLENVIGVPPASITQIYNGVDTEKFMPEPDSDQIITANEVGNQKVILGTVGRLDPIKDQVSLLRAFAELVEQVGNEGIDLRLVIVGDGPMRGDLADLVAELQLGQSVDFTGASNDVAAILRSFDIFILPSLNEGISNTILEAMATNLPVIATDVGGNPELVRDGMNGQLVASGDVKAMANAIGVYIRDPQLRRQHGAAGRARVSEHFSMNSMIDRYTRLYDQELSDSIGHLRAAG